MSDDYTPRPGYGAEPQSQASAWYRAAGRSAPRQEPPAAEKGYFRPEGQAYAYQPPTAEQRKRRRRTKIVALSVCGVLICAAVALAVLRSPLRFSWRWNFTGPAIGDSYSFGSGDEAGGFGGDWDNGYDDFKDYFADYYAHSSEISLPEAQVGTGVTLPLWPQREEKLTLQQVYERVSPAVVGINTYLAGDEYSWGTGVVFSPDGYIITNTHVLQGCDAAKVVFTDGKEYDAKLVGADEISDIAVLYIEGTDLPYAEFGRSDTLQVGDEAIAIGNPLGQAYTGTMTNGIISAIDRNIVYDGHSMTLLQTNAALNEGNSGGPLINAGGQVIGITNMKIMSTYSATVEGIGFAIPSSVVKQIADALMENGIVPGEATIGIMAGPVGMEARERYGLPDGIYVSEVSEGSDALEKGLQVGDVITAVDGQSVSTVADVNAIKEKKAVGDTVTLTVYRDGKTMELEIALVDKGDIQ